MTKPIIELENICKRYEISHEVQSSYSTLAESFSSRMNNLKKYVTSSFDRTQKKILNNGPEVFLALNNISFSVFEGDCVGIIGSNGAGKSTLLKIMSRIIAPTSGRMIINGHIASLLEVGVGFHHELSGRENIFLNGSLLGMRKKDIINRFDEIVEFSGVEKFLDTPVKRYSSGMYARLGFSIAAHLNPDVLIVDEVLAVGDMMFQEKCFKKLNKLASEGKTIIFVSHDINSVLKLCTRAIFMERGEVEFSGSADECVRAYLRKYTGLKIEWEGLHKCEGLIVHKAFYVKKEKGNEYYFQGEPVEIVIEYTIESDDDAYYLQIEIMDERGYLIAQSRTLDYPDIKLKEIGNKILFSLDSSLLHAGGFMLKIRPCKKGVGLPQDSIDLKLDVQESIDKGILSERRWGLKLPHFWVKSF